MIPDGYGTGWGWGRRSRGCQFTSVERQSARIVHVGDRALHRPRGVRAGAAVKVKAVDLDVLDEKVAGIASGIEAVIHKAHDDALSPGGTVRAEIAAKRNRLPLARAA